MQQHLASLPNITHSKREAISCAIDAAHELAICAISRDTAWKYPSRNDLLNTVYADTERLNQKTPIVSDPVSGVMWGIFMCVCYISSISTQPPPNLLSHQNVFATSSQQPVFFLFSF